ncbi:MAG: patatin-like phospholipase family protein [Burkholderiales bacterium]
MTSAKLNLALQGGGAHGAFTWGVLDGLLQDDSVEFEGLSGSSAGALNAVLFAEGWRKGGREGARRALDEFWAELGHQVPFEFFVTGEGETIALSPASRLMMKWARQFSPEQMNPSGRNPLRDLLLEHIDFAALARASPFKLFVGATQAATGKLRVFREREMSVDVLLATSCLPQLHRAVTIEGESYWDGGFSANPPVFPLFYDCDCADVLLVLLSPLRHQRAPKSAHEIEQRALELSFSANFMREMRVFMDTTAMARSSWLPLGSLERRLRKQRFHMIHPQDQAIMQRTETKLIAHAPFLAFLRARGLLAAQGWLKQHLPAVGQQSSVNLNDWFG